MSLALGSPCRLFFIANKKANDTLRLLFPNATSFVRVGGQTD